MSYFCSGNLPAMEGTDFRRGAWLARAKRAERALFRVADAPTQSGRGSRTRNDTSIALRSGRTVSLKSWPVGLQASGWLLRRSAALQRDAGSHRSGVLRAIEYLEA